MAKIRLMPEDLANKIAAGEVVERPASVVKELVENAIDGDGRAISVDVQGSLCRGIRVADNGSGMEEDDVLLALERHATSKISGEQDLRAIHTLGFRGEALPSLAAVSRFEVRSRTRESSAGTCVRVAGGVVKEVGACGCAPGTQVWVRDLFFNQPARRKFLRTERTEFGRVVDTLIRLALGRPDIHFSLRHRNRLVHDWPGAENLKQRLAQVFPTGLTQSWVPFSCQRGALSIRGYLSPPELHRSHRRLLFMYVNGRPIQDRLLSTALVEAYRSLIPKGGFPLGVLFVELPAEQVDVNVHPTKTEVRIRDIKSLCDAVTSAGRTALSKMEKQRWSRPLAGSKELTHTKEPPQAPLEYGWKQRQVVESQLPDYRTVADTCRDATASSQAPQVGELFGELTIIGQLHHTYILCEAPDGLVVIDQHAAHERVLFESLRKEAAAGSLAGQILMVPGTIEFTAEETAWLQDSLTLFSRLGFRLEFFGGRTFMVRAVPAALLRQEPLSLLQDLVAAGCGERIDPAPEAALESLLCWLACRLAIKAGQRLEREEITALLRQLDGLDYCSTCPHGRPLWWKFTMREVERIFHRT
ncbi:MAG: DNA mismatch repair endonuclease MutL [Syntrophobacteria bacterium]